MALQTKTYLNRDLVEAEIFLLKNLLFPETPKTDFLPMPGKGVILVRPISLDRERGSVFQAFETGRNQEVEMRVHGIRRKVHLSPINEDWLVVYL